MEIRADKYLVTGIPARGWLFAVETHFDLLSGRNRQSALASERPKASTIAEKCAVDGGLTLHGSC